MTFKERVHTLLAEKNNFSKSDADFSKLEVEVVQHEEGNGYLSYEVIAFEVDGFVSLADGRNIYVSETLSWRDWGTEINEALSQLVR